MCRKGVEAVHMKYMEMKPIQKHILVSTPYKCYIWQKNTALSFEHF